MWGISTGITNIFAYGLLFGSEICSLLDNDERKLGISEGTDMFLFTFLNKGFRYGSLNGFSLGWENGLFFVVVVCSE